MTNWRVATEVPTLIPVTWYGLHPRCAPFMQPHELSVALKRISTFISLETGHPAFALAAIDWNVSWSMPGIFAVMDAPR
jgi:hypothetical protein